MDSPDHDDHLDEIISTIALSIGTQVQKRGGRSARQAGGAPAFEALRVHVLREYLHREFAPPHVDWRGVRQGFDLRRAIDDFVFLCFFVGNDFLPHMPALEIRDGAIDALLLIYKRGVSSKWKGYLTANGEVNLVRAESLFQQLGALEVSILESRQWQAEAERRRRAEGVERREQQRRLLEETEERMGAAVAGGDAPSVYAGCGRSARVLAAKGVYSSAGVSVSAGVSAAAGLTLGKRYREGESTRAPPPSAPPSPPGEWEEEEEELDGGGITHGGGAIAPAAAACAVAPPAAAPPTHGQPVPPPNVPSHYLFDHVTELWMPPSQMPTRAPAPPSSGPTPSGPPPNGPPPNGPPTPAAAHSATHALGPLWPPAPLAAVPPSPVPLPPQRAAMQAPTLQPLDFGGAPPEFRGGGGGGGGRGGGKAGAPLRGGANFEGGAAHFGGGGAHFRGGAPNWVHESERDYRREDDARDFALAVKERVERAAEPSEEQQFDHVRYGAPGWKDRYYQHKLSFGLDEEGEESRRKMGAEYVRGLCWVLRYYYQGVPSWEWYYPYHYAPVASDLGGLSNVDTRFEVGEPFEPLEQLMAVLPPLSRGALPQPLAELMGGDSTLADMYPERFEQDLNGASSMWKAIALLPFIDRSRLRAAVETRRTRLSAEEAARNRFGPSYIYVSGVSAVAQEVWRLAPPPHPP